VVLVVVDVVVLVVWVVLLVCNALELAPLTNQAATTPRLRRTPPAKTAAARRLIPILLSGRDFTEQRGRHDILASAAPKRRTSKQKPYSWTPSRVAVGKTRRCAQADPQPRLRGGRRVRELVRRSDSPLGLQAAVSGQRLRGERAAG